MRQHEEKKLERRPGRIQGIGVLTWLSGVYPVTMVFLALLAWTTAWVQLGHRPRYWANDPKQISIDISLMLVALYLLAILWLVAAWISTVLWMIGLVSRILQRENLWPVAIPPLAWGALVAWRTGIPAQCLNG